MPRLLVPSQFSQSLEAKSHCGEEGWLGKDGAEPGGNAGAVDGGEGGLFCRED